MTSSNSIFNTHTERVGIPPATAWAAFLDRTLWMPSFGSRTLVSGVDGTPGAIAEVTMMAGESPVRREETLFCEENRRLVIRVTAEGMAMAAHADFQFDRAPEGCRIQVSIHCWMPGASGEERLRMHALTQAKIADDFGRLRDMLHSAK